MTDDWTDDNPEPARRTGLLTNLSERQGEVMDLMSASREAEDKTLEQGLTGHLGWDDEIVVAAVLATKENSRDPNSEITNFDLIWAGALLDHLDTLGFEIRRKKTKKGKKG